MADITSLIQVFNHLNPVIIVDESHNATSELSMGMLKDLNPAMVLDLTATPRKNSNVISFVDAMQLKKEKMVKLPVIVYNRPSQKQVIVDALDLRSKIDKIAEENKTKTGIYLRPIVLFQAQPKTDDDNTTFEVLKQKLISIGIPEEEIAIKTANVNELKNIELLNENCKIKYIVTVNALKEGWDCPFAYILASLANKTSSVDVEQIVGRILRQPYARNYDNNLLNMSYVLTSSNDFNTTLNSVLSGLNSAGFSDKDYRAFELSDDEKQTMYSEPVDEKIFTVEEEITEFDFDVEEVKKELENKDKTENVGSSLDEMMNQAKTLHDNYNIQAEESNFGGDFGAEKDLINVVDVSYDFRGLLDEMILPQFYTQVAPNIFNETEALVTRELLLEDFTLQDKPIPTNLAETTDEVIKIDVEESYGHESRVRTSQMSGRELAHFKAHLSQVPDERLSALLVDTIYKQLEGMNSITATELKIFITRIINSLKQDELIAVRDNVFSVVHKTKQAIEFLKEEHAYIAFKKNVEKGSITVKYNYKFPNAIGPNKSKSAVSKSFYHEEADDMNNTELDIIRLVAGMPNIKCWHRIMERKPNEFYINGFTNHYPDFWIVTESGKLILLEVKGEQFSGEATQRKAELGRIWQNEANNKFKYFMVYKDRDMNFQGAYKLNDFIDILRSL
jgi:type III restriction enzyme